MKTPEDAVPLVAKRLRDSWDQVVAGAAWSPEFQLGTSQLKGRRLEAVWPETHRGTMQWDDWVVATPGEGVALVSRRVQVWDSPQALPATLRVATIDVAARLVGGEWPARLDRARARRVVLAAQFPGLADPAAKLRATDGYSDVDFELLCRAAAWFAALHPAGLTARQVPVEGIGTKWLEAHKSVVRRLAGVDELGLLRGRPPRVHLTYLDPDHLRAGGRRHDLATVGDVETVAYRPRVVLISENRDTAQLFPPFESGIAIEGEGRGAGAVAQLAWVHEAETLWNWGDMDADGLEILHGFRAAGLQVRSLFMDMAAYERWARYGVDHDHRGGPLTARTPRDVSLLEPGERDSTSRCARPSGPGIGGSSRSGYRSMTRRPSYVLSGWLGSRSRVVTEARPRRACRSGINRASRRRGTA
jgi:hypothetical protein